MQQPSVWTGVPLSTMVSGKKVVIDAGHGGRDPGAKAQTGLREKDLNLDVALMLKKQLSRLGIYCVMIRETDRDFCDEGADLPNKKRQDLIHRVRIANEHRADIYLSIHANSFPQTQYRGAQTFFEPDNPDSRRLAASIQAQLVQRLGPNKRQIKPGDFRVLKSTGMPAVTIEVGFLSNPEEAQLLGRSEYREKLAEAICHGVIDYFTHP